MYWDLRGNISGLCHRPTSWLVEEPEAQSIGLCAVVEALLVERILFDLLVWLRELSL